MDKNILMSIFQKSINTYAKNKNITLYNLNTIYDCMMSIIERGYCVTFNSDAKNYLITNHSDILKCEKYKIVNYKISLLEEC